MAGTIVVYVQEPTATRSKDKVKLKGQFSLPGSPLSERNREGKVRECDRPKETSEGTERYMTERQDAAQVKMKKKKKLTIFR